jgi:hypothetical protein
MAYRYRVEGVDKQKRRLAASFWFDVKEGDAIDEAKAFLEMLWAGKMVRHAYGKEELVAPHGVRVHPHGGLAGGHEGERGPRGYGDIGGPIAERGGDMKNQWIEFSGTWRDFRNADLNLPGTRIEVQDLNDSAQLMLIGDVNINGGVCDDCMGFGYFAKVTKYLPPAQEET